jgi:hypothetical protein
MNKLIIGVSVYNSFSNLENIFFEIKNSLKKKFVEIVVIDNNSQIDLTKKKKLIKSLNNKYKIPVTLIINHANYGMGGSQKILFNFLKKKKFDYYLNLHSSGRYSTFKVLTAVLHNLAKKYDYIIFSRFLSKSNIKNYSKIRSIGNLFFIKLTVFLSSCKFSDPGNAIYCISSELFNKLKFDDLTNSSQFNHLLNIIIFKKLPIFKEIAIEWGEGKVKSHLQVFPYVITLFLQLISYFFFSRFNFFSQEKKFNFKTNYFFFNNK